MDEELLNPEQAAAFLGIHLDSVRRLLRQGKLPGVKVGGSWRIQRSRLKDMLDGKVVMKEKKPAATKKRAVPRKPPASAGPAPGKRKARKTGTSGD